MALYSGGIPHSTPQEKATSLAVPLCIPEMLTVGKLRHRALALSVGKLRHRALHCHHPLAMALETFCSPGGTAAYRGALKGMPSSTKGLGTNWRPPAGDPRDASSQG